MIPGEPPSSWQRPPRRKQVMLRLYNPFRQPFMLSAVVSTIVLVSIGTLPVYVLVLVIGATFRLRWDY